jgi:hypothetical protein
MTDQTGLVERASVDGPAYYNHHSDHRVEEEFRYSAKP